MNTTVMYDWHAKNQLYLADALSYIRALLEMHAAASDEESISTLPAYPVWEGASSAQPPMIERICTLFALSSFERDVLLLCAGVELDAQIAAFCSALQGGMGARVLPTFGLALAVLPQAHWSALLPNAPLRRWRLLTVAGENGLTAGALRIDEGILHYLTGLHYLDERLAALLEMAGNATALASSHQELTARIAAQWARLEPLAMLPVIQLCGNEAVDKYAIATELCRQLNLNLYRLVAQDLPLQAAEFETFVRLWEREVLLSGSALFVDCDDLEAVEPGRERGIVRLLETLKGALTVSSREPRHTVQRHMYTFDVYKPAATEQRALWQSIPGMAALNGSFDALIAQFHLNALHMFTVSSELQGYLATHPATTRDEIAQFAWDTCRMQTRSRLDELAQRIELAAAWDDLVLPDMQRQILRDIIVHVKQRARVYDAWGFASKSTRGLGISALFAGVSGTGKTMAAEVLANELRLDLYRIDLSQAVSKYIGETEKNLRRLFDAAEEGGAILLFDEADALFGKRSEVRDSHDRYANIEVSYLLQRMETYRGLTILTTNLKSALDTAFLRRIRFIIQFPFPDPAQRYEIWKRIFPADTPTENLDEKKLARLNVAGGNIRNIALNAAFLAADADEPVKMSHLLRAARNEYLKLEKSLTDAEIGGWL